jgi:DNA-binding NarL/FixJ family response regulator
MVHMQLILCETTGDWAAELSRRLPAHVSVVETRSVEELLDQLKSAPTAIVALELLPQRAEKCLAALVRINREFPQAAAVVLAQRNQFAWEQLVREAGTVHFVSSIRHISELVNLVRHRSVSVENFPPADESASLEDQILASLPWGV